MEEIETQHSNMEEGEMGQLHALHLNANAWHAHQLRNKPTGPSLEECADCGDDIPKERQEAVMGCTRCIFCQSKFERK